jgi:hypothetical protein
LSKPIGTTDVLGVFEERLRIEIADLATNFAIVIGGIERINRMNAANSILQIGPKRLDIIA